MSARAWWSCAESRRPRRSDNTPFQLQIAMAGLVLAITPLGPAGRRQTPGDGRPVSGPSASGQPDRGITLLLAAICAGNAALLGIKRSNILFVAPLKLLYRKIISSVGRRQMRFLPVFLDLQSGVVVLVGSGEPALSKLRLLDAAGARVRWYASGGDVEPAGIAGLRDGRVTLGIGDPRCADWSDVIAVVAAAGAPLDADIASCARALRIPVNVVDRPDLSTFIVPAIVDRGDVVVAIGTGGAAPVLARRLRARISALMPRGVGRLAALMGQYRARLNAALTSVADRKNFWERVIDGPVGGAVLAGQSNAETLLSDAVDDAARAERMAASSAAGTVFLVGAGPGDPDLLTLRA